MWVYEKRLEYPVKVHTCNPALAQMILEQFGGADGELAAALRYLTQRYYMPIGQAKAVLTDIGTEELAHWEMIATMAWRLVKDAPIEKIKGTPFEAHFANHGRNPYPHNAAGAPFTVTYFNAKSDPITDMHEDMAAEEKARATYEHLIQLSDDPGVTDTLRFLREREIVHFQRFGETLELLKEHKQKKPFY